MLDFTVTLCSDRDISTGDLRINTQKYFEMLSKDKDEVIMLLNYYIELGTSKDGEIKSEIKVENNSVKDNDKAFWQMI